MKLTAFLGSPRPGGNTDTLAARVIEGAAQAGIETETLALRRMDIRPCVGCVRCWSQGTPCVFQDDMTQIYDAISASDVLLLATPVYWYAPTAIMKAMIDRLVPLNRSQGRKLVDGKSAILVVAYEEEGPAAAEPLLQMIKMSFNYLGVKLIDTVVVDGVGPRDAILRKPDALEQAFQVGRSLRAACEGGK